MNAMRDTYLYDIREERIRVLRLQKLLRALSQLVGEAGWNTVENGIYDETTRSAVRSFQRMNGLPPNGILDLTTWEAMRLLFEEQQKKSMPPTLIQPFPDSSRRIAEGEYSDLVLQMQIMLNGLRLYYDAIPPLPLSGRYDAMTAEAVRVFRRIHLLAEDSGVDASLWNRLAEEYNRISPENQ